MKKLVTVTEVDGEGLEAFLGQKVLIMCENYSYCGTVEGVNDTFIKLSADDASIVYETGPWNAKKYTDQQMIGSAHYVMKAKIESFTAGK